MRGATRPTQEDCRYSLLKFDVRNKTYWCEFYGYLDLTCAGLKSAEQYKKPFTCPHCLQRPDVQAQLAILPPSQTLKIDIPDGTGQSSGLTQGIKNMNISDPVRKAPETSAKTVLEDIRAAQYQVLTLNPKASRTNFAPVMSGTITKIISNTSDVEYWRRLLLMPKICLKAQPRAGQKKKTSFATLVSREIGNFCQNEYLTSLVAAHIDRKFSKKKKGSARPNLKSSKSDEGNIRGAVCIASSAVVWSRPEVFFFVWNLQTVFPLKPMFSGGPSLFVFLVCNDGALNLRLHVAALPAPLTLSWPNKTIMKKKMSGLDFLVLVLQSSNSFDLNAFFQVLFSLILTLHKGHIQLLFLGAVCSTGLLAQGKNFIFFFAEIFKRFFTRNSCFRKVLHFLYFLFLMMGL